MGLILFLIIWASSFAICRALCIKFEDYFDSVELIGLWFSIIPLFNIPLILGIIGLEYFIEEEIDEKIGDWFFKRKD